MVKAQAIPIVQLTRPYKFTSPWPGEMFAVLLLVTDTSVTSEEQALVAKDLVAQGCRYAVCAGLNSSSWDDAVDEASTLAELAGAPSWGFCVTTWHEGEPLEDVVEFFMEHAIVQDAQVSRLAVVVGPDQSHLAELGNALRRY